MSSTDKPLETYLEMDEKEVITKQSVRKLHDEQILNGNHHKKNELEILEILGGIDVILSVYLDESHDILLTNKQILRLHQLLKTPIPYQHKNKPVLSPKIMVNNQINNEQQTGCLYTFDVHDTILHSLFSTKSAEKIKHFIDNQIVIILGTIAAIIGPCLWFGFGDQSMIVNVYGIIVCLLWIPWLIFKHFSFNKTGFILCLKTFDFWMKTCYGFIATVAVIFHGAVSPEDGDILLIVRECMTGLVAVSFISYIAAFDASNSSKTKKLVISIAAALFASYLSIYVQFFESEEYDYKITIQLTKSVISMQSMFASSCRILAIFIWKQVVKTLFKNGRAVSITRSPIIIWSDCNANKQNVIIYNKEKEDKTERMEINLEEENEEINTENVLIQREQKTESISFSIPMGNDQGSKSKEENENEFRE